MISIAQFHSRFLSRGFAALCALTYCLIVFGAMVRAKDAGLACPDWPLCFGEVIPQFDAKVAFEWGHRLLASFVSVGLFVLSVLVLAKSELRAWMKPRLSVAWVLLLVQIVFGGLTVLLKLSAWTVSAHLVLGNSFCLTLLWIACDLQTYAEREMNASLNWPKRPALSTGVRGLAFVTAAILVLQFILGGLVSGHYAGLACTTFPTCNGDQIIPNFAGHVGLHVVHRMNGLLLLLSFFALAIWTRKIDHIGMLARAGARVVFLQVFIGIANVLFKLPFELTALHTAFAAALALIMALLIREIVYSRSESSYGTAMRIVEAR